jgi:hypothetical protein
MKRTEFQDYQQRVAARLRSLAEITTTPGMRARLLEKAEHHERLASGEAEAREF